MKTSFHITSSSLPSNEEMITLIEAGEKFGSFALLEKESLSLVEFTQFESDRAGESLVNEMLKSTSADSSAISFWTPESIIVPSDHFTLQDVPLHLNLLNGIATDKSVHSESISNWDVHNIYRMPSHIPDYISKKFSTRNQWHHYTITLKKLSNNSLNGVYVDFRTDEFSVVIVNNKKLLLAQVYTYSTPEDVLYYLLKIFRQLQLSQREANVYLSGFIDENSAVMRELHKYFLNVQFESLPGGIQLSESFQQYPSHFFNSISKLGACVLLVEN